MDGEGEAERAAVVERVALGHADSERVAATEREALGDGVVAGDAVVPPESEAAGADCVALTEGEGENERAAVVE